MSGRRAARATGHESPARFPRRAGLFIFSDDSGTSPSDFVIVVTKLDPVIHLLRKAVLRGWMDARIKSGHNGRVLWREVR
jgi:hypothetical protein